MKESCENCLWHRTIKDDNNELWTYCKINEQEMALDNKCECWAENE